MEISNKTRSGIRVEKWPGITSADTWRVTLDGSDPRFFRSESDAYAHAKYLMVARDPGQITDLWEYQQIIPGDRADIRIVQDDLPDTYGDF
jgi:hypothetical protein